MLHGGIKKPMQTQSHHPVVNQPIVLAIVASNLAALFVLPWLLPHQPALALLALPLALTSVPHWGLIHEGIHKHLHPDPEVNERLSRLLGIFMGASFHVLRFGHLMHHKLNRNWHSECVARRTLAARLGYYFNLTCGLYLSEVVTGLLMAFLPRAAFLRFARATALKGYDEVTLAGDRFFYQRQQVRAVRQDVAAMLLILCMAFVIYGPYWPVLMAFIATRAIAVSFLDNIYHYETPADNSKAGKELYLSPRLSRLLLHSNYHETHHLNPDVPWRELPAAHAAQSRVYDGNWGQHAVAQLAGPPVH